MFQVFSYFKTVSCFSSERHEDKLSAYPLQYKSGCDPQFLAWAETVMPKYIMYLVWNKYLLVFVFAWPTSSNYSMRIWVPAIATKAGLRGSIWETLSLGRISAQYSSNGLGFKHTVVLLWCKNIPYSMYILSLDLLLAMEIWGNIICGYSFSIAANLSNSTPNAFGQLLQASGFPGTSKAVVIYSFTCSLDLLSVSAIQLMNNTFDFIVSHCISLISFWLKEVSVCARIIETSKSHPWPQTLRSHAFTWLSACLWSCTSLQNTPLVQLHSICTICYKIRLEITR